MCFFWYISEITVINLPLFCLIEQSSIAVRQKDQYIALIFPQNYNWKYLGKLDDLGFKKWHEFFYYVLFCFVLFSFPEVLFIINLFKNWGNRYPYDRNHSAATEYFEVLQKRQNLTILIREIDLLKVIAEVVLSCCCLFFHWSYLDCFLANIVRTWRCYI